MFQTHAFHSGLQISNVTVKIKWKHFLLYTKWWNPPVSDAKVLMPDTPKYLTTLANVFQYGQHLKSRTGADISCKGIHIEDSAWFYIGSCSPLNYCFRSAPGRHIYCQPKTYKVGDVWNSDFISTKLYLHSKPNHLNMQTNLFLL